jgi:hypothetical protein
MSAECAIVLPVTIGAVDGEPAIECVGFPVPASGSDACTTWPGVIGPVMNEGRYLRPFVPSVSFGHKFALELELTADGALSLARFCRSQYTDVGGGCPPSDWSCASSGTITLSAVPTEATVSSIRGAIDVTFPGGETVDAIF